MQSLDEQGLLQDVCQHPEEDGPRLVMADWYEDNGQPERAEFIRAQVELAGLAPVEYMSESELCFHDDPQQFCYQCRGLRDRAKELLNAHGLSEWVPDGWEGWVKGKLAFRRGFIESLVLPRADWMKHGKALAKASPLTEVRLSDQSPVKAEGEERYVWALHRGDFAAFSGWLTHELFDCLLPDVNCTRVNDGMILSTREYESEADAAAALSRACLKWARSPDPTV